MTSRVEKRQDAVKSANSGDSARTPAGDEVSELVVHVFRLDGLLTAAGDQMAQPAGQTSARWRVLAAIEDQPLTVPQVARAWWLSRQSVQRVADVLVQEGLAAYRNNPAIAGPSCFGSRSRATQRFARSETCGSDGPTLSAPRSGRWIFARRTWFLLGSFGPWRGVRRSCERTLLRITHAEATSGGPTNPTNLDSRGPVYMGPGASSTTRPPPIALAER